MSLPTESEINPIPEDLDGQVAVRNFLGKTIDEAVALFDESFGYEEDLMFMGPKAFCFYLPAVLKYLEREDDDDLVCCLPGLFEYRLDNDGQEIESSFPTIAQICEHLLEQPDDYVGPVEKQKFREILARIRA